VSLGQEQINGSPPSQGYPSSANRYRDPVATGTKVIVYTRGRYVVIDRYVGYESFVGQTIYYLNHRAVFGLNYAGAVLSKQIPADAIYAFLKRALAMNDKGHRGPEHYEEGDFTYHNRSSSTLGGVAGEELIEMRGDIVYRLDYRGCAIADSRSLRHRSRNVKSTRSLLLALRMLHEKVTRRSRRSPRRRRMPTTDSSE
jgi:hypothetical protein